MTDYERGICPMCGQETTIYYIRDDVVLCEDCAADECWDQCAICGDFYQVEYMTLLDDDRLVCEYCMEEGIEDEPD